MIKINFGTSYVPISVAEPLSRKNDVAVPNIVTDCYHLSAFRRLLMNIHELQIGGSLEVLILANSETLCFTMKEWCA
jgi:hypothetical protein